MRNLLRHWRETVRGMMGDRISLMGVALTTAAALSMMWVWGLEILGVHPSNPYFGILLFLVLPGIFVFGLLLIPLGLWRRRRRLRMSGETEDLQPLHISTPSVKRAVVFVVTATAVNIALVGVATSKGMHYLDSNQFCGLTCHSVMAPEYGAFKDSAHSRVGCAQCHIGPGADWFVKAKISGLRQVWAVVAGTYHRPIPSPVENLRPARETCEQCHWPQKFHGDKMQVRVKYEEDEANTPSYTVVMLRLGGRSPKGALGIHGRHLDEGSRIQYAAGDEKRHQIPRVLYKDDQGKTVEYLDESTELRPEAVAKLPLRSMDCVDCHNRPTHVFDLPGAAIDRALQEGRIAKDLPFLKKQGLALLKAEYKSRDEVTQKLPQALAAFYQANHPAVAQSRAADIKVAGEALRDMHLKNVYPDMKLTWGTHANHIGHVNQLGCFRCHAGSHSSKDGKGIKSDCNTCHELLAQDEQDPKVLATFGIK